MCCATGETEGDGVVRNSKVGSNDRDGLCLLLCGGAQTKASVFFCGPSPLPGAAACALTPGSVYADVVVRYMTQVGIAGDNMGPHALRATAATSALEHQADIAKVQEWLGHASIGTTRVYDRRGFRPEDSPTFKVAYG